MQWNIASLYRAGFVVLLLAGTAVAGPLPTDGAAMPAWQGSTIFTSAKITATVEYAVYAPGDFSSSSDLDTPPDPSSNNDYVYAYEILPGTVAVKDLTVFTEPGSVPVSYVGSNRIGDYSYFPELGLPSTAKIFNTDIDVAYIANVKWTRASVTPLWKNASGHSDILFFTSPHGPQFVQAAISGGGSIIATSSLPSPMVPEPGTVVLAAIAAACLLATGRFRKRFSAR